MSTARCARWPYPPDLRRLVVGELAAVVGGELVQLLVDGGVHEHRQDAGCGAVDGRMLTLVELPEFVLWQLI